MRMIALGDYHSNAGALDAALVQAEALGMDRLFLLGDCLTYGVEPERTLDLLETAIEKFDATLFVGNHDQMYLELISGERDYYNKLPDWIRESVDWTIEHCDMKRFAGLPWEKRSVVEGVLVSHANPYEFPNWQYLNTHEEIGQAGRALHSQGAHVGLFGHTHRAAVALVDTATVEVSDSLAFSGTLTESQSLILNSGSTGQPRSKTKLSTMIRLDVDGRALTVQSETINYDVEKHKSALRGANLSNQTTEQLLRYFL
jgi:predicted phosphodiesterase